MQWGKMEHARESLLPLVKMSDDIVEIADPEMYQQFAPTPVLSQLSESTSIEISDEMGSMYSADRLSKTVSLNASTTVTISDNAPNAYTPLLPIEDSADDVKAQGKNITGELGVADSALLSGSAKGVEQDSLKSSDSKSFWKKNILYIISSIIVIVGVIIGIAVYFATRPAKTNEFVSANDGNITAIGTSRVSRSLSASVSLALSSSVPSSPTSTATISVSPSNAQVNSPNASLIASPAQQPPGASPQPPPAASPQAPPPPPSPSPQSPANSPATLLDKGSSCSSSSQCRQNNCGSGVCGGNGASCSSQSDCVNYCILGSCASSLLPREASCGCTCECAGGLSCGGGYCGGLGGQCKVDDDCAFQYWCGSGVCGGKGATCQSKVDCINNYNCVSGTCI
ncbi:hypothetical protein HK098_001330 [Nowakowskiella sp. JEL0407]|nr:hypothetical protein HK098_001330 [Nowakowskiella sp. JEL0407]